jgi:hypothetical protein
MGSHGSDGHTERVGNLLVAALFLMIEDEDGSFDLAELLKLLFDRLLELAFFYLLLGVAIRVGEAVFPAGGVVGERDVGAVVAAAPLPLILGNVDRDAVEVGSNQGVAAKAGQGTIEPEKDILGEIVDVFAAAGKAQEGAEDHVLMVAYHLLEGEIGAQAGLDLKQG